MSDGQGPSSTTTPTSTPASSSPFACTVCSKTYKRREHLQRHVLSHAPVPPHRCSICGSCYRRPDVLKRHFATCQARANGGSLSSLKRRACDRCVQSKKGCSTGQPCNNCRAKGVVCEYSFAKEAGMESMDAFWAGNNMSTDLDSSRVEEDDTANSVNDDSIDNDDGTSDATGDAQFVVVDNPVSVGGTVLQSDKNITTIDINTDYDMHHAPTMMELTHPSPFAYLDSNATDFLLDSNNHIRVHNTSWLNFLNLTNEGQAMTTGSDDDENQKRNSYTFHFLDNFTKKTGLVTFDCGTRLQATQVVDSLRLMSDANINSGLIPNTNIIGSGTDPRLSLDSSFSFPLHASPFQDPLIVKTHQILFRIREVATVKPRNSTVTLDWSTALEQQCLQFFSPPNLHKFLALYWARWHPNVNIVHRPTFDPVDSKCVLVVAMALIGACLSPDADDNKQASVWFNCVEEIVFIDDDFCSPPQGIDPLTSGSVFDPVTNKRKIQALQASYIVCLYQNWEGTDESKQRIRRYRFSTVVSVARDIGIGSARHVDYSAAPFHAFHWKAFVAREQLIRTFLWIYLLDQAFVIFNNLPPRVMIKEMVMHMAWPESTFQATTAADCAREAQLWLRRSAPLHNITLREVVECFCSGVIVPEVCRTFADLGPLNLFCIVSAFHFLIFQKQNSFGGEDQLHAIRTGLANWKNVWEVYKSDFADSPPHTMVPVPEPNTEDTTAPDDMWRRTGFMRNSPEYWLLAHLVMDRLSTQTQHQSRLLHSAIYSHLHASQQTVDNTARDPILAKYDETSMRQVNDLISQFRNVQIL